MNKHTPAPWHVGIGNGEGSIFSDSGRTRLEDGGTTLYPICSYNRGWNADEDAANARLIASAPDLLETLRELIVQIYEDVPDDIVSDHFRDALVAAEAAIHKATGDAQ
jgi:hypothetical protein